MSAPTDKISLRVMTCGSVDDGKSTLIGRLLYDCKKVFTDQEEQLNSLSRQFGTQGKELDLALLVDGLQAEREQGITIDVAYRYLSTENRRFIVADTPGHEQYTRNMATAASNSDVAMLLVDARQGIATQTERHTRIVAMMGIQHVILTVNKMDLVNYEEGAFRGIEKNYRGFIEEFGFKSVTCIPISALNGANVATQSADMPWYDAPPLLPVLEDIDASEDGTEELGFQFPVQMVLRPNSEFRGYCGTVASGSIKVGDPVRIVPTGATSEITRLITYDGDLPEAKTAEAITIELADDVDISRGDVISAADHAVQAATLFEAELFWMGDEKLIPARQYLMRMHNKLSQAVVLEIKHRLDVNTGSKLATNQLEKNDIGRVVIQTHEPMPFTPYADNKPLGSLILIDRLSHETSAAGTIDYALRRSSNVHWQKTDVTKELRSEQLHQSPKCLFFTGLSGSGKSTIAVALENRLHAEGKATYLLDGDNVRHGLNRDLGFTEADRAENIRRVAEVSRLMVEAGLIVLVSFISPFRSEREFARSRFEDGEFFEIFVDTPLEVCEQRDVKGLYAKARAGELKNFTGIDSAYEAPENPEAVVNTENMEIPDIVDSLIEQIGLL